MANKFAIALLSLALVGAVKVVREAVDDEEDPDLSGCDCLPWKEAYALSKCGDGHEMDLVAFKYPGAKSMGGSLLAQNPALKFQFCEMFYYNLPNDAGCINTLMGNNTQSWCYVSPGCSEKAGKRQKEVPYSKICKATDQHLGDKPFEVLAKYIYDNKLELGLAVQYAYNQLESVELPDVMRFWHLRPTVDILHGKPAWPISQAVRQQLEAQVASGKPAFINSRTGHPPFGVMEGSKLYWINFSDKITQRQKELFESAQAFGLLSLESKDKEDANDVWQHKEDMRAWRCVAGCDESTLGQIF